MIATGKSTLAQALEDMTGFRLSSSDVVRKGLANVAPQRRMNAAYGEGIYDRSFDDKTYSALLDQARATLGQAKGMIIDASFKDKEWRRRFLKEAQAGKFPIVFVECQATEAEIFDRLRTRELADERVSDATWQL